MKKSSLFIAAAAMALTALSAQAAPAPAPAAAAPATPVAAPPPPPTFGAATQGQCVLDVSTAMATSKIGKSASDRLGQLGAVVKSELTTDDTNLSNEYKTLMAGQKAASATPAGKSQWDAKYQAFGQKYEDFQKKQQQRSQEMQLTQQSVMGWIFNQMIAPINQVVSARGCSTVINSDSLLHYSLPDSNGQAQADFLYTNPSMNITSDVVAKLDAANVTLPQFDRANLDQPAQGAAAPAGAQ